MAGGLEETHPAVIQVGGDGNVAIARFHRLARRIELARIARRAGGWHEGLVAQMFHQGEAGDRLEHRHLDLLAFAGAQPVHHGGKHRIGRVQPRDLVGQRHRDITRLRVAVCPWQQRRDARGGLDDVVVGLQARIRSALVEAGAMHVDDVGPDRADFLIRQPGARDGVVAHVVNEDVAGLDQPVHGGAPGFALEVPVDRAFAPVEPQVDRAHERRVWWRADDADGVAFGRLQLDHLGAEVGQDLRAIGAEDHRREVGDAQAFEHAG